MILGNLSFSCEKKILVRVADDYDFIALQLQVSGAPDPDTGMILNLIHIEEALAHLETFLGKMRFSTMKEALEGAYQQVEKLLAAYSVKAFEVAFAQPHVGVTYRFSGQQIKIELKKFMRYQDAFGYARVGFDFEGYAKLADRERRQDFWQMGMAESPAEALKGRFPLALWWEFANEITGELQKLERI